MISVDSGPLSDGDMESLNSLPPGTRVYRVFRRVSRGLRVERLLVRLRRRIISGRMPGATPPVSGNGGAGPRSAGSRPGSLPPEEIRWRWREPRTVVRALNSWLSFCRARTWTRDVARVGKALALRQHYDLIATSGPPHSAHLAGVAVSRAAGAPLALDLRDPWSLPHRVPEPIASPLWFRLARWRERRAVARASLIITNTDPVRHAMAELYPHRSDRLVTVMNGSDEDPLPEQPRPERFVVAYAGAIYLDRDPRPFFRGAAAMVRDLGLSPRQFEVVFVGDVRKYGPEAVADIARHEGLSGYLTLLPPMARPELLERLTAASMLLSLPQDSPFAVPSKVFEYMQFRAWVLALATPESPTAVALQGTNADVVDPDDPASIAAVLRRRYLQFAAGETPDPPDPEGRLSRRRQAQVLLEAMERIVGPSRDTPASTVSCSR